MVALKLLVLLALLLVSMLVAGILLNRPPLTQPPGAWSRLQLYLTTNVAQTGDAPVLPELRTRRYPVVPEAARRAVLQAISGLSWKVVDAAQPGAIHAVVTSALWRFEDDVLVWVRSADGGSAIEVRSSSRVGRGDLAANAHHVLDLYAALGTLLGPQHRVAGGGSRR